MIKAIFFDFDDTLGNREVYAYDCYRDILKAYTKELDSLTFESILQDVMLWDERGNKNKNYVKEMLMDKYQIAIPYEEFNEKWDSNLWKYCVPFEGAAEVLQSLGKQYKLGIITNGPSFGQRKKLDQSGLRNYFAEEAIIVSGDFGYKKPDLRLFQVAMERLGVQPEESVYVGDIFRNDVYGAIQAGMHAIWIWTAGKRKCSLAIPVIHDIRELEKTVCNIQNKCL